MVSAGCLPHCWHPNYSFQSPVWNRIAQHTSQLRSLPSCAPSTRPPRLYIPGCRASLTTVPWYRAFSRPLGHQWWLRKPLTPALANFTHFLGFEACFFLSEPTPALVVPRDPHPCRVFFASNAPPPPCCPADLPTGQWGGGRWTKAFATHWQWGPVVPPPPVPHIPSCGPWGPLSPPWWMCRTALLLQFLAGSPSGWSPPSPARA